jgi:hypothetical protein
VAQWVATFAAAHGWYGILPFGGSTIRLFPPEPSMPSECSSMFSALRAPMRNQNPWKFGRPSGVRGGLNVLAFSSPQRCNTAGSSEQPPDSPYGRIGVGPDPGGGVA